MLQGHAPTAGHDTGLAGREEAGKALPQLAQGFSLSAGERGQIPKALDWRSLSPCVR